MLFLLVILREIVHTADLETRITRNLLIFSQFHLEWQSVQLSSVAQSCPALCDPMDCSTPGLPVHHQLQSLLKLMSLESVMPSNYVILCCPLLFLSSVFPSIRICSNESVLCIRWPKYWSFSLRSVLAMNIQDWFPWGLPGLASLQSKGLPRVFSNTTVQKHQFLSTQLSSQTIALTRWTFVGTVMSMLFIG